MTIPSWAHVGAKVICVDDTSRGLVGIGYIWGDDPIPRRGTVCTVAGHADTYGEPHLIIAGYPNNRDGENLGWHLSRFRPLISQSDDIATHFAKHLDVREPVGV